MITYTPNSAFPGGADNFTYYAVGYGTGNNSAPATVSMTVATPNAPTISAISQTAVPYNSSTAVTIPIPVSSGTAYTVAIVSPGPAKGTATVSGSSILYTPTANAYGADSFQVTAHNSGGTSAAATVPILIANPPPPTAATLTLGVNYGVSGTIDLSSGAGGRYSSITLGTPVAQHGTVTISGTSATYTPNPLTYFGADTFTYTVTGPGGSTSNTVNVTVATPGSPVSGNAAASTNYQTATTVDLSHSITGVFTSTAITLQPSHGTVSLSGHVATYTPAALYYGNDSFGYNASGPGGTSGTGTISITVGLPPAPTLASSQVNVTFDTPLTVTLTANGVYQSFAITAQPTHGTASISGSSLTYTPGNGYYGTDTLSYTTTGPGGTSTPATLTLMVVRPPPPVVGALTVTVPFDQPKAISFATDITGYFNTIALAAQPQSGTATVSGSTITYTPNRGYFGPDSFSVSASGPGGTSAPALVSITVITQAAAAANAQLTLTLNTSGTLQLSNYVTGSGITGAKIISPPAHGTASMAGTLLTYTPRSNYFGADQLSYQAFGALGVSNVATVTINVTGRPDPSQDADVQGVVSSELSAAQRFARAQSSNFQSHLQSLHSSSLTEETDEENPDDRLHRPVTPGTAPGAATPGYSQAAPGTLAPGGLFATSGSNSTAPILSTGSTASATPAATQSMPTAASVRSDSVVNTNGSNPLLSQFAGASMVKTNYFPGTPPSYADNAVIAQSITSVNLGSLAGSMMENQEAASVDHHGLSSVWVLGSVNFGERTPGGATQNFGTDGISMGVDYRLSRQLVLGVGAGYGTDRTTIGTDGTHTRSSGVDVAFYGSYAPTDRSFVDAVIGVGSLDFDASRTVAPIDSTATSHRSGDQKFASISAGYDWSKSGAHVEPYVRLDYADNDLQGMTETGAGAYNLSYSKQDQTSVAAAVGLRVEATQSFDYGVARPHANIEYEHEFDGNQSVNLNYASFAGTSYSITPSVLDRNTLTVGFGADYLLRHGLSLGWDYQVLHASGIENSQTIRFKVSQDLDQNFVLPLVSLKPLVNVRGDLGYTYDDNVTRSVDKLSDQSWNLGLSRIFAMQLNDNTRISLEPSLGFEKFETYVGLSHADAGIRAELQYRASGDFSSPIYSFFTKLSGSNYETTLRDGERLQMGLSGYLPVTDRINAFSAIGIDARHATSAVFNGTSAFLRLNLDYALTSSATIYAGGEFRAGDLVSSGFVTLNNLDDAKIYVLDDAFPHSGRIAYRFNGQTGIGSLGYNLGLSSTSSVDLSYRIILATPNYQPEYDSPTIRYVDHQLSLVYLVRF